MSRDEAGRDYRDVPVEKSPALRLSEIERQKRVDRSLPLSHPDNAIDWSQHPLSRHLPQTTEEYKDLSAEMNALASRDPETWAHRMRILGINDTVWLLSEILSTRLWFHPEIPGLKLFHHQYLIDLCRDAQFLTQLYECLTIVSRGHCKSTIWTLAEQIRQHLENPALTSITFSIVQGVSDSFIRQIKSEFERNELLRALYSDRIWANPRKEAEVWSMGGGLSLPNPMGYKDPSIKGVGLIDGSTTGTRVTRAFYDDCVNEKVVTNPEMIEKCNERWEMSLNLGTPETRRLYVGTFYAGGDSYHHMLEQGVRLNFKSCYEINWEKSKFTDNGVPSNIVLNRSAPCLFSRTYLETQEERMGPTMFAVQMVGSPTSYEVTEFREEWFKKYDVSPREMRSHTNTLILVDPANSKGSNKHSRTAMVVLGLGALGRIYLLDGVLDRLNLSERTDALFDLVSKWGSDHPVRYEELGHHSDIDHIRGEMSRRGIHFEVYPVKGNIPKLKRIERLIPLAERGKILFPRDGINYVMRESNKLIDICRWVMDKEFLPFPNVQHLDFIDAFARLEEPGLTNDYHGRQGGREDKWRDAFYKDDKPVKSAVSWMGR